MIKHVKKPLVGTLLIIILIIGGWLRVNIENKPHYDDARIYESIEFMIENDTLDPNFYNHPNHTGIYLYAGIFKAADFFAFTDSFKSNFYDERPFFVQIGHAITKSIGVLEIGLAFLVGLQFNAAIGLLYALLIALFPELIWRSDDLRPDILFNALYTATILLLLRYWKAPSNTHVIACSALIALLTATKYPGILLIAPLFLAIYLKNKQSKNYVQLVIGGLGILIFLLVIMPYVFIHIGTAIEMLKYEGRPSHQGMKILGLFGNLFFYIQNFAKQSSLALVPLALYGALQAKKQDGLWIVIVASCTLYISLSTMNLHWSRWGLPFYSSWLLLASVGVYTTYLWIKKLFNT